MKTFLIELTPVVSLAFEVIAGKYGVGEERKKALEKMGVDYNKVQRCVNDLIALMKKYGG